MKEDGSCVGRKREDGSCVGRKGGNKEASFVMSVGGNVNEVRKGKECRRRGTGRERRRDDGRIMRRKEKGEGRKEW